MDWAYLLITLGQLSTHAYGALGAQDITHVSKLMGDSVRRAEENQGAFRLAVLEGFSVHSTASPFVRSFVLSFFRSFLFFSFLFFFSFAKRERERKKERKKERQSRSKLGVHYSLADADDGRKPTNVKPLAAAGNPQTATAVATAQGPGNDMTLKPLDATCCTRLAPGSDRAGVPASDTYPTDWPRDRACSTISAR